MVDVIAYTHTLHACGTLCSHNDKTPLLCAAEAGHDEIVAYLLQFTKVRTDLQNQPEKVYSASVSYSCKLVQINLNRLSYKLLLSIPL